MAKADKEKTVSISFYAPPDLEAEIASRLPSTLRSKSAEIIYLLRRGLAAEAAEQKKG